VNYPFIVKKREFGLSRCFVLFFHALCVFQKSSKNHADTKIRMLLDFWNVARSSRLRSYVVRSQEIRLTYMNACENPQPWRLWYETSNPLIFILVFLYLIRVIFTS